jgi:hypothetical protein
MRLAAEKAVAADVVLVAEVTVAAEITVWVHRRLRKFRDIFT